MVLNRGSVLVGTSDGGLRELSLGASATAHGTEEIATVESGRNRYRVGTEWRLVNRKQ